MKFVVAVFGIVIPALCICIAGFSALAAEDVMTITEQAKDEFEAGKARFHEGKYEEAAIAFRNAYQLKPSWKLWYNIAQSEAAAKNYDLALESFESYLAEAGDEISDEKEAFVLSEIEKLKSRIGYLDFNLRENVKIQIDDIVRGVTPLAGQLRVVSGLTHQLQLQQNGEVILQREIKVGSQETLPITLDSPDENAASQKDLSDDMPPLKDQGQKKGTVIGWSLVGAGAAFTIAGAITGIAALSKANDIEERCPNDICGSEADMELQDTGRHLGVATNILIGTGIATAAAGTLILILKHRNHRESLSRVQKTKAIVWQLSPVGIGGSF